EAAWAVGISAARRRIDRGMRRALLLLVAAPRAAAGRAAPGGQVPTRGTGKRRAERRASARGTNRGTAAGTGRKRYLHARSPRRSLRGRFLRSAFSAAGHH